MLVIWIVVIIIIIIVVVVVVGSEYPLMKPG